MYLERWTIAYLIIAYLFSLASPLMGLFWLSLAVLNEYVHRAF